MIKNIKIPTKCPAYHGIMIDVYVRKYVDILNPDDTYYFHSYCDFMCYSKYCDECSISARQIAIDKQL